jgi:hypothetical protein
MDEEASEFEIVVLHEMSCEDCEVCDTFFGVHCLRYTSRSYCSAGKGVVAGGR